MGNKYHARRTFSALCKRTFSSKAEAKRGEELEIMDLYGHIDTLEYQKKFVLSEKPNRKVTITIDFAYKDENGEQKYEDTKGVLTRDFRTKLAWLKQLHGIDVELTK